MAIQNKCHMRYKPYTKVYTHTTIATSFCHSTPNIKPLGPRRVQRYLQPKHQHLHGRGDSHVRITGSMSPQAQQYKTH
jgi:hypothetical protein